VIDFDGEGWAGLAPGTGRLDRFVTPKGLGAGEDD
jgi:phosphohistidine phosphatase